MRTTSVYVVIAVQCCLIVAVLGARKIQVTREKTNTSSAALSIVEVPQVPDYSGLTLPDSPTYLRCLVFIDTQILKAYNDNFVHAKNGIMRMFREANEYFYQLGIRLTIVDIVSLEQADLTVVEFLKWLRDRRAKLPSYDFAAFLSFRYAGGFAFLGGMCGSKNVVRCGFYPKQPEYMARHFVRQTAILTGLDPKIPKNNTLSCKCGQKEMTTECQRIFNFDYDCSAQMVVDLLPKQSCLRSGKQNSFHSTTNLSICGNKVLEGEEECDCGPATKCQSWNCRASDCRHKMSPLLLTLILMSFAAFALALIYRHLPTQPIDVNDVLVRVKEWLPFDRESAPKRNFSFDEPKYDVPPVNIPVVKREELQKMFEPPEVLIILSPKTAKSTQCLQRCYGGDTSAVSSGFYGSTPNVDLLREQQRDSHTDSDYDAHHFRISHKFRSFDSDSDSREREYANSLSSTH